MPKFSANIGFLWPELSLVERVFAAKQAGFPAIEMHWPNTPAENISKALKQTGLELLSMNTAPGNSDAGEFGLAAVAGAESRARASIDQAIEYAAVVGAKNVHIMAGINPNEQQATNVFLSNLRYASPIAAAAGIGILIEPINRKDRPGYGLHHSSQALIIIDALRTSDGIENVQLMFDCYHTGITEGNVEQRLTQCLPYIEHVQIASVPQRHEPDSGDVDYQSLFHLIDNLGYKGYIGAEYIPRDTTDGGLKWYQPWRPALS